MSGLLPPRPSPPLMACGAGSSGAPGGAPVPPGPGWLAGAPVPLAPWGSGSTCPAGSLQRQGRASYYSADFSRASSEHITDYNTIVRSPKNERFVRCRCNNQGVHGHLANVQENHGFRQGPVLAGGVGHAHMDFYPGNASSAYRPGRFLGKVRPTFGKVSSALGVLPVRTYGR